MRSVNQALPIAEPQVAYLGLYHRRAVCLEGGWMTLQVRLDEPQLLIGLTADLGEDIRGVGISEPCGLTDGFTHRLAEYCKGR